MKTEGVVLVGRNNGGYGMGLVYFIDACEWIVGVGIVPYSSTAEMRRDCYVLLLLSRCKVHDHL